VSARLDPPSSSPAAYAAARDYRRSKLASRTAAPANPVDVNAVDPDGRSDGEVPPLAPPGVVFGTAPGGIGTARTPDQGQDLVHTGYTRRSQTSNDGQRST
jgi:hypothetical protein